MAGDSFRIYDLGLCDTQREKNQELWGLAWLLSHILNGSQNLHDQWLETIRERRGQKPKLLSVQEHLESAPTGEG